MLSKVVLPRESALMARAGRNRAAISAGRLCPIKLMDFVLMTTEAADVAKRLSLAAKSIAFIRTVVPVHVFSMDNQP